MSIERNTAPNFWSRLGRAFVNILRFLLILAVIAAVAAAVYFGVPYLYEKFIVPVETNTARLSEGEDKAAADVDQLAEQVSALQTRLSDLETRQTESAQAIAELEGQLEVVVSVLDAQSETLKSLEAIQASLDDLSAVSAEHEALQDDYNSILTDLQRQVSLSRSIELLSRARLYLSQSNYGLARQDVLAARNQLSSLQTNMPTEKSDALRGAIFRLDLALDNLPAFPVVAVDDVDIAWQLLIRDLPDIPYETLIPVRPTEASTLVDKTGEMPTPGEASVTPTPDQTIRTPIPTQSTGSPTPEKIVGTPNPAAEVTPTPTLTK